MNDDRAANHHPIQVYFQQQPTLNILPCYTAHMDTILTFSSDLALKTGQMLRDRFKIQGMQVDLKADRSVVTEADMAADQLIRSAIQTNYPQDGILSEEDQTAFPANKTAVWVIDPLDGTTNFSLGLHYWGVSIARLIEGQPQLAALYFPMIDELYTAVAGEGAFLNGDRLEVPATPARNQQPFFSCCSRTHRFYQVKIKYKTRILGSAAFSLLSVARGSAILAFESTPKVWDLSGAWLVVQEAGGEIHPFSGSMPFPLVPGQDYGHTSYPTLAAPNLEIWTRGKAGIIEK
jgi:myo-inositol-1(or 4)-monophosphatase